MSSPRAPSEIGESLVELLVTISILGIAFVGVLSGLGTVAIASDTHRKEAVSEVVVRNLAERLVDPAAVPYVPCATTGSYSGTGLALPPGYRASVIGVAFWDGRNPAGFTSSTPATCPLGDAGVQRLTIQVASTDDRAVESVDLYKRVP